MDRDGSEPVTPPEEIVETAGGTEITTVNFAPIPVAVPAEQVPA